MLKSIDTSADFLSRDSRSLGGTIFRCSECGRPHAVPIQAMAAGPDLVDAVPVFANRALGHTPNRVCVLYDRAIESLIQREILAPLDRTGLPMVTLGVGSPNDVLDSEVQLGDDIVERIDPHSELLIGAGSGVICDLTKWAATRRNIPFLILATAPSMNAYTSITATMTENEVKTSRLLNPAAAVLMDSRLQATVPIDMIYAGMGDLAARAICNADWKLASLLKGIPFCSIPYQMTAENERKYLQASAAIARREHTALDHLSEAILMSGLSMTVLDGETSPSSGAEHVISHFWDLLTHTHGLPKNLHGTQVGVGTMIMLAYYAVMRTVDIGKIDPLRLLRSRPSVENIEWDNNQRYGKAAALFNQVVRRKRISDAHFVDSIREIQQRWDSLWLSISPYIASLEAIRSPLRAAGMPLTLTSVRRTKNEAEEALIKGPQYRLRYTLLDLAAELGLAQELSDIVLEKAGVLE